MSTTTQPPKPRRRWYQFSLRSLLIAIAMFAVLLASSKIVYEGLIKWVTPVWFGPR